MQTITLSARFDGQQILLDEPYALEPNATLMITILPKPLAEQEEWTRLAAQNLAQAYGDDEPEYSVADLKKRNPAYRES